MAIGQVVIEIKWPLQTLLHLKITPFPKVKKTKNKTKSCPICFLFVRAYLYTITLKKIYEADIKGAFKSNSCICLKLIHLIVCLFRFVLSFLVDLLSPAQRLVATFFIFCFYFKLPFSKISGYYEAKIYRKCLKCHFPSAVVPSITQIPKDVHAKCP